VRREEAGLQLALVKLVEGELHFSEEEKKGPLLGVRNLLHQKGEPLPQEKEKGSSLP